MKGFGKLKSIFVRPSIPMMPATADGSKLPPVIAVAPDKFKGTLTAAEVSSIIADGLRVIPDIDLRVYPMADGGEGSAAILAEEMHLAPASAEVHDAYMQPCTAQYFTDGHTAAVDCAAVVGLAMLGDRPLDPWHATSYGFGEIIRHILDSGVGEIFVGIGGTASTDAGAGMLQALGARYFDCWGNPIGNGRAVVAADLCNIFSVDFSRMDRRNLRQRITVLADVNVPLTPAATDMEAGHSMSALSFARQKGMPETDLPDLGRALNNFRHAVDATLLAPAVEPPFQGAGGGLGYAFRRVLKCPTHAGAKYMATHYGIFSSDPLPNIVITGEGCYDEQSSEGKVVGTLCDEASRRGIPVVVVAGRSTISRAGLFQTSAYIDAETPLNHSTAEAALRASLPYVASSIKRMLLEAKKL